MSLSPVLSVLVVAVAFSLPAIGFYRRRTATDDLDWPRLRRALLGNWAILLGLVLVVGITGEPGDLGLRVPSVGVLVDGLLFGFIAFAGTMLLVGLCFRFAGGLTADAASLVVLDQPVARRLAVAITGATVETALFFGLTIEASLALGSGPLIAGAVAAAGVVLVRARWGPTHALQWLPGAVVLAGIAVLTRTLLVVFVIRLVYDTITLLSGDTDDYRVPEDVQ